MDTPNAEHNKQLEDIARKNLEIETLATRNSDRLDFHSVAVWSVQKALMEAVELGRQLQKEESEQEAADGEAQWRRLAMQFDGHRMQALGHLRCMVQNPVRHKEQAEKFLSAGPLSGEKVLAERIEAIVAEMLAKGQIATQ